MRKLDLAAEIRNRMGGISKREALLLTEILLETMREVLSKGHPLKITGFGVFEVRYKRARKGRNPQTGDSLVIPARRVLTFHPSQLLRGLLNR